MLRYNVIIKKSLYHGTSLYKKGLSTIITVNGAKVAIGRSCSSRF